MFIIKGWPKDIKFLTKYLTKLGYEVQPTTEDKYIVTVRDPSGDIPEIYRNRTEVKVLTDSWIKLAKEYDCLKQLVDAPKEYSYGAPVKVISGEFRELTGRVIRNGNGSCDVELEAWGKPMKVTIPHSDLEVFDSPFLTTD